MIQRICRIINNSIGLKAFVTSCKDFIISAKFFIIWGLGILYAFFAFIHYVLLLLNNCGLLTDIVSTICGLIFCAICVVIIWIILELVALVIETKHPISVGELEAKCIDADSRCFPRDDPQERKNESENIIENKFFTEGVQNTQPVFHNAIAQHKLSKNLNNKEHFVRGCAESRLPSSKRKQKSRHQIRTEIDKPSTAAQRSKSLSLETKKSTLNFTQRLEQRNFSPTFVPSTAPIEQKPLNISPLYKFPENSTPSLLDSAKSISEISSTRNRMEYSKNSAPELVSLLCKNENHSFKRKYLDQPNTSATTFESRCFNRKDDKHFGGNQTELWCEKTSSKANLYSRSNLEVGEPSDDSSAERTATASEGDSSMTEDSPTKIHNESVLENSKSTFSSKLCTPSCGNICTIHSNLGSKIKNGDGLETITGLKRKQSVCVKNDSDSAVNSDCIDIKITDSINDSNTNKSTKRGTSFKIETTSTSDTKAKVSVSYNELVLSEVITNDEETIKNDDVREKTKIYKEKLTARVKTNSDFATNTTCLDAKIVDSNKDSRNSDLNKNIQTRSSFGFETMIDTDTDTSASFSCNESSSSENKAETTIFPKPITTSLDTASTIPSSSVQKPSSPDTSMSTSHISKLETLTSNLNSETLTKLTDSQTQMMSSKYKRSLSITLGESRNVSSLKRKYESSSSDSSSDNSWNGTSKKRRAKRRTKSCFSGDKHTFTQNSEKNEKERKPF